MKTSLNNKKQRFRQGSVVLITGASSGLGRQLSLLYSKQKFRIILTGRSQQRLQQTQNLCKKKGQSEIITYTTDLSKQQNCKKLIQFIIEKFNRLDYIILNAGVNAHFKFSELQNITIFEDLMKINFFSNVYLTKYALPHIKKSKGTILVISSLSGKFGLPDRSGYCASKFALTGFFQSLRTQQDQIKIILVFPTSLNTDMRKHDLLKQDNSKINDQKQFDVKQCATIIIEKVQKNIQDIYIPFKGQLGVYVQPFFPKLLREQLKKSAKL